MNRGPWWLVSSLALAASAYACTEGATPDCSDPKAACGPYLSEAGVSDTGADVSADAAAGDAAIDSGDAATDAPSDASDDGDASDPDAQDPDAGGT
jgi:hypothetical protein